MMSQANSKIATQEARLRGGRKKRLAIWLGFAAVFVPLLLLLGMQYLWLNNLQHTSAIARQVKMEKYLTKLTAEVEELYMRNADLALAVYPETLSEKYFHKVPYHFQKRLKKIRGARRFFVVSYQNATRGTVHYYDAETNTMVVPEFSPEVQAVYVAVAPWTVLSKEWGQVEAPTLQVDNREPDHRMILYPITDEKANLMGVAGMILDEEYFVEKFLPKIIEKLLPDTVGGDALAVWVRDGAQQLRFGPDGRDENGEAQVELAESFSFVFTDWTVGLGGHETDHQRWAKTNFAFNLTLSLVLAAVLLGGILWALRIATREMKLSEMKNDFVSNVSHELRTPLASIRVFGEFLRLGRVQEEAKVREYGEYIETESRRLTQLINNILDFSRIESGQKEYRFEKADVDEVVSAALEIYEVRLRHHGFEIDLQRPVAALPRVRMDPGAIGQAVCNLLDNAVKYSNGSLKITVGLRRVGDSVMISVRDRGVGIPRAEQERIFERFHRVGTGLVHDVKGSGLGLSIVQHIVEAHGGRVEVESEPGKGSLFSIFLPAEPTEDDAAVDAPAPGADLSSATS